MVYKEYLEKCTNERPESSDATNPNLLIRVEVREGDDNFHPKKKGPAGPRKPREPLAADLDCMMALPVIQG